MTYYISSTHPIPGVTLPRPGADGLYYIDIYRSLKVSFNTLASIEAEEPEAYAFVTMLHPIRSAPTVLSSLAS